MEGSGPRVTIEDLAREAGVAKSTASLAFSAPARLKPETLARVRAVADRLGYAPNAWAQGLRTGRHNLLGLMMSDMTNPWNGAFFAAVQGEAMARGFLVLAATTHDDPDREAVILEQFRSIRARGAILTATGARPGQDRQYGRLEAPIVTFDQKVAGLACDHVSLDHRDATRRLTQRLLDVGHRRIGHVAGRRGTWSAEERLAGVREALAEAGLPLDPALIADGLYQEEESRQAARELLDRPDRPTGLVAANNAAAAGCLRAMSELGLRCPEDVSLVAVDGLPWPGHGAVSICAAVQPIEVMAHLAADMLFERIERLGPSSGRDVLLRAELIPGSSVAAPPF